MRLVFAAALILLASSLLGCPKEAKNERLWIACSCTYVTDFDQPGHVSLEVCGASAPENAAEGCARGLGVGAVTACSCTPPGPEKCAPTETCRQAP